MARVETIAIERNGQRAVINKSIYDSKIMKLWTKKEIESISDEPSQEDLIVKDEEIKPKRRGKNKKNGGSHN